MELEKYRDRHNLRVRGKEIELQIVCEALRRDHDESMQDIKTNNKFHLECLEQDIFSAAKLRSQKEQQHILN